MYNLILLLKFNPYFNIRYIKKNLIYFSFIFLSNIQKVDFINSSLDNYEA